MLSLSWSISKPNFGAEITSEAVLNPNFEEESSFYLDRNLLGLLPDAPGLLPGSALAFVGNHTPWV